MEGTATLFENRNSIDHNWNAGNRYHPESEAGTSAAIRAQTDWLNQIAFRVETSWDTAPPGVRALLVASAYAEPRHVAVLGRLRSFVFNLRIARLAVRDPDAVAAWASASVRLRDAVLTAVEEENPRFHEDLKKALEGVNQARPGAVIEEGREHEFFSSL